MNVTFSLHKLSILPKELNHDQLEFFNNQVKEYQECLLFCSLAEACLNMRKKETVVVSVTDVGIAFYRSKNGIDNWKHELFFDWLELDEIHYLDMWITLRFGEILLTFQCPNARSAMDSIGKQLNCVFSLDFIEAFPLLIKYRDETTRPDVKARFMCSCRQQKLIAPKEILKKLRHYRKKIPPTDLSVIQPLGKYTSAFLDIYNLFPFITRLTIPDYHASGLPKFLSTNHTLTELVLSEKVPSNLKDILSSISQNPRSKVRNIIFLRCDVTQATIKLLRDYPKLQLVESPSHVNISSLILPTVKEISISDTLISKITCPNITSLSLVRCSIDLSSFFSQELPRSLTSLDLSGNFCKKPIISDVILPTGLTKLSLNQMVIDEESLTHILSNFKKITSLSLAETHVTQKVIDRITSSDNSQMEVFRWDGNPITKQIATFISRSGDRLQELSLNESPLIPAICDLLPTLYGLRKLSIRSTDHPTDPILLHQILMTLRDLVALSELDLNGQQLNVECLHEIAFLASSNQELSKLDIDNSRSFFDYSVYDYFVLRMEQRSKPINISLEKSITSLPITPEATDLLQARIFLLKIKPEVPDDRQMMDFTSLLDDDENYASCNLLPFSIPRRTLRPHHHKASIASSSTLPTLCRISLNPMNEESLKKKRRKKKRDYSSIVHSISIDVAKNKQHGEDDFAEEIEKHKKKHRHRHKTFTSHMDPTLPKSLPNLSIEIAQEVEEEETLGEIDPDIQPLMMPDSLQF